MLKLINFSCGYHGHKVLKNINLEIPSHQVIAIIGNNGSGKSTLMQALAGLKSDFLGQIWLDDLLIQKTTPLYKIRQKASLVLQNPDHQIIFNEVYDDLAFILQNLQIPPNQHDRLIFSALETVGMEKFIHANTRQLSGGQKQKIIIASALLGKPAYLLLDEATSMLDFASREFVYKIIQKLKEQGITICFTTNWLEEIIHADQVIIIEQEQLYLYAKTYLIAHPSILRRHHLRLPDSFLRSWS